MYPFMLAAVLAATPSPSPAATPLKVIETIVTSDRRAEPIDQTSRPTFVVTRAQMEARGDRSVAEALRGLPGIDITSYGPFGAQSTVGVRGASAAQTLVLLDGTPIATASNGVLDLGTLSTSGVSRIEVVEGGVSTLYGTAAVGGVINIITDVPRGTYAAASTGSFGARDLRAAIGDGHLGLVLERRLAVNDYPYPALDGFPAGTRSNDDAQSTAMRLSYETPRAGLWRLRGSLGSSAVSIGVPGSLSFPSSQARQLTSFDEGHVEAQRAGAHSLLSVTLSGSRQALPYRDPAFGGESATYDGRAQVAIRDVIDGARTTLVTGLDIARESMLEDLGAGAIPPTPPQFTARASQVGAYAQQSWTLGGGTRLFAGLRGEHDTPNGGIVAPEAGALMPVGSLRLAANLGESFRVPTLIDLYYPGFSNPALRPEHSRNADVTLEAPQLLGGASLGWFGRHANDLIQLDQNFVPQNVQHAEIDGLTASVRTKPFNAFVVRLDATDLYRALDTSPGAAAARLRFEPVLQVSLGIERPFVGNAPAFGIRAQIVGPHIDYFTTSTGMAPPIDSYTTVDAYLRMHLTRDALLTLRARNLGNDGYATVYGYPAARRTYELEISTR
ncbi:TonB-dependent receptor [bacterium]|nr:MAG: TonB-dependent receptor [bacterium]